ncbi:MAG TPA: response regulator, partial [Nitrososphaera sp.]|nr:response regulator [Nitrososphaera sp.]
MIQETLGFSSCDNRKPLLDIKMPEMSGLDLYQKMKEIDSNVKICFITASEL